MALADRLCRTPGSVPLSVHVFQAVIAEWARGNITAQQARDGLASDSGGVALTPGEETEAQNLVSSITSIPVTGSATQIADGRARRALRAAEIDQVLLLASARVAPYDNPSTLKTRLGF